MGQAPSQEKFQYLIIGAGRMARHFCHYLSCLGIPYLQWSRRTDSLQQLHDKAAQSTHILLLISDNAIENFIQEHPFIREKQLVHFSGCLISPLIPSAHPLMTFGSTLYELSEYQRIPFIIEAEGPAFADLLPAIKNQHFAIPRARKPYYHTLCVMANNFTTLLWQRFFAEMKDHFNITESALIPFLQQSFKNLLNQHQKALTGPLARGDHATIQTNLASLAGDPFQQVYAAFVTAHEYMKKKRKT